MRCYGAQFTDGNTEVGEQGIVLTTKPDCASLHHSASWRSPTLWPAFPAQRQGILDRIQTEWEEYVTSALIGRAVVVLANEWEGMLEGRPLCGVNVGL